MSPEAESGSHSEDESEVGSIDERDLIEATLPEPEPVQIKIRTLHLRYRRGLINLNPHYQRDVVWSANRQSDLINSIFNNFYVPPVIFQCRRDIDPRSEKARVVMYQTAIDGKQRLSSIIAFMAGKISYRDPKGQKWWYPVQEAYKRHGKILTQELKDKFDEWSLLCIEYTGLTNRQEEDLFARVQQGMALSNDEKQMAIRTPWITFIKQLMVTNKTLRELSPDPRRGKDFGNFASAISMIYHASQLTAGDTLPLRVSQSAVSKLINKMNYGPPDAELAGRLRLVFATWSQIYQDYPATFTHSLDSSTSKKFSSIEFSATAVLLHHWLDKRDNKTLNSDILAMRRWIRSKQRTGIRGISTSLANWSILWEFICSVEKLVGQGKRPSQRITPPVIENTPHSEELVVPQEQLTLSSGAINVSSPSKSPAKKPVRSKRPSRATVAEASLEGPASQLPAKAAAPLPGDHSSMKENLTLPSQMPTSQRSDSAGEEDDEIFGTDNVGPDQIASSAGEQPVTHATIPPPYYGYPIFPPEFLAMWQQALVAQAGNSLGSPNPPNPYAFAPFPGQFPPVWPQVPPPASAQATRQSSAAPSQIQQPFMGYPLMQPNGYPALPHGAPWQQPFQMAPRTPQQQQLHTDIASTTVSQSPAPQALPTPQASTVEHESEGSTSERKHKRQKTQLG